VVVASHQDIPAVSVCRGDSLGQAVLVVVVVVVVAVVAVAAAAERVLGWRRKMIVVAGVMLATVMRLAVLERCPMFERPPLLLLLR